MAGRSPRIALALAAGLALAACSRPPAGPVRTPMQASEAAQRELRAAGLDEEVIAVDRQDGDWLVTTRWRETSLAGHLVTVDAATGAVKVERYRALQLGRWR